MAETSRKIALVPNAVVAGPVALSAAIGLLVTLCHVAQGLFLALFLDSLMSGAADAAASRWLFALAAVIPVRAALLWSGELAAQVTARRVKDDLRIRLLSRLAGIGPAVAMGRRAGDLQGALVGGVEALESYYSRYIPAIAAAFLGCGSVLGVLAWVDWPTALLLGGFVVAYPLLDRLWLRWQMPETSGVFAAMADFGSHLLESLQGMTTLKAFDAAGRRRGALAQRAADLRRESMAALSLTMMRTGLTGFVTLMGVAATLCVGAWRAAAGSLSGFALLLMLFLAREAFRPLARLEQEFHTAWAAGGAKAPILELLREEPAVRDPAQARPAPTTADIVFDAVSFGYPARGENALSSVSMRIGEGEFVAVVGASGSGKSTLASLLLRLFDPRTGSIRIGGVDIRELPLRTLRSLIGFVPQHPLLFHGTIEDNLRLARPEATRPELQAAAEAAQIADFIAGLPQGYATQIGEAGATLSGGQRQRLAIARALLADTPILVLDEATSNLDAQGERAFLEALLALPERRTILAITHRLSSFAAADRVLVLDEGCLVEAGDPGSLRRDGGVYARLLAAEGEAA